MENQHGHGRRSFSHLKPKVEQDDDTVLPSFASIRQRTLDTLYGSDDTHHDKSFKGSVDAPIQHLVDLINAHPSFATLSSCSGRISLYDPGTSRAAVPAARLGDDETEGHSPSAAPEPSERGNSQSASGKGSSGRWLLVSHEVIEQEQLLSLFPKDDPADSTVGSNYTSSSSVLSFQMEPMLLHVAAASLKRGQQLLQVALGNGWRESGLVVTPSRVTVAIRSQALSLTVPLARRGPLRPTRSYLEALVELANDRLQHNQARLERLYQSVQQSLFTAKETRLFAGAQSLPPLNLWNAATVLVTVGDTLQQRSDVDILVLGGYGSGPELKDDDGCPTSSKRSDAVYRLRRRKLQWEEHWQKVTRLNERPRDDKPVLLFGGLRVKPTTLWTGREGAAACLLPLGAGDTSSAVVAVFGGRQSPRHPLDDLFLVDYSSQDTTAIVCEPLDVRGESPSARWAHTFTALSGKDGRLALLVGGRNESDGLDSTHLLSLKSDVDGAYLVWERVASNDPACTSPRFHHSTVAVDGGDVVFVLGGWRDPAAMLEAFDDHEASRTLYIDTSHTPPTVTSLAVNVPRFGHASCAVDIQSSASSLETTRILVAGGVPITDSTVSDEEDELPILCFRPCRTDTGLELIPETIQLPNDLDVGPLVHYACLAVPSPDNKPSQVVAVGGGVAGFAFSPCWASSRCWEVSLDEESSTTPRPTTDDSSPSPEPLKSVKDSDTSRASPTRPLSTTRVVFVKKPDAKLLKTTLEQLSFMDKGYRMTAVDSSAVPSTCAWKDHVEDYIAVPVTSQCWQQLEENCNETTSTNSQLSWMSLVAGKGQQVCPLSTSQFARHTKVQRQSN